MAITCPACGKAKLKRREIPRLETEFEGVAIVVPNAIVSECPECEKRTYSAKELKRWKEIKENSLAEVGALPNGEDVRAVREQLGLSVAQFADLIAVTRQTVHSWERASDETMKLGPAAILVSMLKQADRGKAIAVTSLLVELAGLRGKPVANWALSEFDDETTASTSSVRLRPTRPPGAVSWKRVA